MRAATRADGYTTCHDYNDPAYDVDLMISASLLCVAVLESSTSRQVAKNGRVLRKAGCAQSNAEFNV